MDQVFLPYHLDPSAIIELGLTQLVGDGVFGRAIARPNTPEFP